jgi:hypothetical protein
LSLKCQYLNGDNCTSIGSSDEAKEIRKIECCNENNQACCYLCDSYRGCEISCNFLGENNKATNKPNVEFNKKKSFLSCPLCDSKMIHNEVKLRIGGWAGLAQLFPFGSLGEVGEDVLPVILYVCPKCGKLEFMAKQKTIQKVINES